MDHEVNDTLFKFLLIEMVPSTIESSQHQHLTNQQINVKLEMLGYKLGIKLNELLLYKLNDQLIKNEENLISVLDIMKFICKDFWKLLFKKQINNLRTNHRGTFVLVDSNFRLIEHLHMNHPQVNNYIGYYLSYVDGIIKAVLKSFGINSLISHDVNFPLVNFNIETEVNN